MGGWPGVMVKAAEEVNTAHLPEKGFGGIKNDVYRRADDADFGYSGSVANSMDSDVAEQYANQKVAWRYTRHGKVSRPVTCAPPQWTNKETHRWPQTLIDAACTRASSLYIPNSKKKLRKLYNNNFNEIVCVMYSLQILAGVYLQTQIPLWMGLFVVLVTYFEENLRSVLLHFTFHTAFW